MHYERTCYQHSRQILESETGRVSLTKSKYTVCIIYLPDTFLPRLIHIICHSFIYEDLENEEACIQLEWLKEFSTRTNLRLSRFLLLNHNRIGTPILVWSSVWTFWTPYWNLASEKRFNIHREGDAVPDTDDKFRKEEHYLTTTDWGAGPRLNLYSLDFQTSVLKHLSQLFLTLASTFIKQFLFPTYNGSNCQWKFHVGVEYWGSAGMIWIHVLLYCIQRLKMGLWSVALQGLPLKVVLLIVNWSILAQILFRAGSSALILWICTAVPYCFWNTYFNYSFDV